MTLPDFLTRDAYDYVHITGHRVGFLDIVHFFKEGELPEMIYLRFPTVALPTIYKAIAFYLENQEAVDAEYVADVERSNRMRNAPQPGPSLEELRRRWEARRLSQGA